MRNLLLLVFTLILVTTFGQTKHSKVTVILFDNQNPCFKVTVDTLYKAKEFNLSHTPVDLFFTHSNFHLPYYVPTDGIFKNVAKDKECDMKIYPATVKCYEYDNKNRVIKMTVDGSGTMNSFAYQYNTKNTQIDDRGTKFILSYNPDGTLSELEQRDGTINKKLVFIYN